MVNRVKGRLKEPAAQPMRHLNSLMDLSRADVESIFELTSTLKDRWEKGDRPQLLTGQAPPGLWEALEALVVAEGYRVSRGDCGGANGLTDYTAREVRVRADVDDGTATGTPDGGVTIDDLLYYLQRFEAGC